MEMQKMGESADYEQDMKRDSWSAENVLCLCPGSG